MVTGGGYSAADVIRATGRSCRRACSWPHQEDLTPSLERRALQSQSGSVRSERPDSTAGQLLPLDRRRASHTDDNFGMYQRLFRRLRRARLPGVQRLSENIKAPGDESTRLLAPLFSGAPERELRSGGQEQVSAVRPGWPGVCPGLPKGYKKSATAQGGRGLLLSCRHAAIGWEAAERLLTMRRPSTRRTSFSRTSTSVTCVSTPLPPEGLVPPPTPTWVMEGLLQLGRRFSSTASPTIDRTRPVPQRTMMGR
jgi:hypothetical protein